MSAYFHGWKRKVGLVTLGLALLMTVAWLRAFRSGSGDSIVYASQFLPSRDNAHKELHCLGFASFEQTLLLSTEEWDAWPSSTGWRLADLRWESYPKPSTELNMEGTKTTLRSAPGSWSACGAVFGSIMTEDFNFRVWAIIVPHYLVVIPLTLLSGRLLLGKPRAKPLTVLEPEHG